MSALGGCRRSTKPAVPKSGFIDQGRRKCVSFADSKVNRAVIEDPLTKAGIVAETGEIAGKIRHFFGYS